MKTPHRAVTLVALGSIWFTLLLDDTQAASMARAANSSAECCDTCIGKPSSAPYSYDPVIFSQCTEVSGGVCCFDCGSMGDPMYGDTVSYADDGVTAVAKTGNFVSFTWSGVENVTYVSLKKGQKKTVTPTVSDAKATKKSDTFLICARSVGTIYFRGWGSDSCREASPEHSITIEEGESGKTTCDANDVQVTMAPSLDSGSVEADDTVATCNQQRASIQVVDGMRTCVCVSDWINPPECDSWPVWKWLVTIGGGVAAFFSIVISIRAFMDNRQKKEDEANQNHLAPMDAKSSQMETMQVTPDNEYQNSDMGPYKYNPETDRITEDARKTDNREFTL